MPKKYFSVSSAIFILFGVVIEVGTKYFFFNRCFCRQMGLYQCSSLNKVIHIIQFKYNIK